MRKKIVAGNWKMNKTAEEALVLTSEIVNIYKDEVRNDAEVVLIPPYVHLTAIHGLAKGSAIKTGAQDCSRYEKGAYTGEISAAMLKSLGLQYVIIGHSERRQYHLEGNALLAEKTNMALKNSLTPIYCCGETLAEREKEIHFDIIRAQVSEGLFHLSQEEITKCVIAYEPVWAIGTGKTASSEQAQEVHAFIRQLLAEKYGKETASAIRILYGGSVKPDNSKELFAQPDIDGGLIGGAALVSRDFIEIIKSA